MNVKIATLSDIGGRSNNDDTVAVRQKEDSAWVFVGDGLGGYAGGQMASEAAANDFTSELEEALKKLSETKENTDDQ